MNMKRIYKALLLIIGIFFMSAGISAQRKEAYNWYFGVHVGMTWNETQTIEQDGKTLNGLPTPLPPSAMEMFEGVFSLSDANGNLLFYSDGTTIWNRNHDEMPNGNGLTGHGSSAQSGIVIPYHGNPNLYIVFTIGMMAMDNLSYSIIDMTADGGFGDVTTKNVPLTGQRGKLGETLAAVRHSNGVDYWIISISKGSATSALNVWKVTAGVVQEDCFDSYLLPTSTPESAASNGYLRFSADGKYFAWPEGDCYNVFFGEFDPSTGNFPVIKVMDTGYLGYGAEFSPSSEILYLTDVSDVWNLQRVNAYKFADLLASANPGSVVPRAVDILETTHRVSPLQLAPDGRIYSTELGTTNMVVIDDVNDYDNFTVHLVDGLITTEIGRAHV